MATSPLNELSFRKDWFEGRTGEKSPTLRYTQPGGLFNGNSIWQMNDDLYDPGRQWINTEVGTGTKAIVLATATKPTVLTLTTGATQHNNIQMQWAKALTSGSTTAAAFAPFICKTGSDIAMRFRFQCTTTAANAAIFAGLSIVDTTLLATSALDATSMIGLWKASGGIATAGIVRTASTNTSAALDAAFTINTWYDFGIYISGRTSVEFWLNGVRTYQSDMTNLPANTVNLAPSFVVAAGTAAAATMEVQSIATWQENI